MRKSAVESGAARLLLIRPDHLGDTLMASPTVELLRKALPAAHITLMVGPWSEGIARRDPLVDEVIVCPFPGFTRGSKASPLAPYSLLRRTASTLRREGYDAALILRFDHWWGSWLAKLAGIPLRVGYDVPECSPFLTHRLPVPDRVHWVEQGLREADLLLRLLGKKAEDGAIQPRLRFQPSQEEESAAEELWSELGLELGRPVVALHPGTGAAIKLWPKEHWIALGSALASLGIAVLVTGAVSERLLVDEIAGGVPGAKALVGRSSFTGLGALFRRCDLVVGVDSGPLHLAVAVDTPSIHLFGPTDPKIFGPWGDPASHVVLAEEESGCGRLDLEPPPGGAPCMRSITPEVVMGECVRLLAERNRERDDLGI